MIAFINNRTKWIAAAAVLTLCLSARVAKADDAILYEKTLKATCWISNPGGDGTGWVLDREQKLIVTNKHVVGTYDDVKVMFPMFKNGQVVTEEGEYVKLPEKWIKGKVLARDPKRDLAIIKLDDIPEGVHQLTLAKTSAKIGDNLLSIGNSGLAGKPVGQGTLWKMRTGAVAVKYFRILFYMNVGQTLETSMLNSSLQTSSGDSGGPVVNDKCELVAVTSGGSQDHKDSFAIDISEVRAFLVKVLDNERRLPFEGRLLTGAWTQKWTNEAGVQVYCGVTLRPDGTVLWEDQKGAYEGTYGVVNGQLTMVVPAMNFATTCEMHWSDNESFTITRNGIEYKLIRR